MKQPRFPTGTTYKPIGRKHAKVCTVTDIHITTNHAGEFVKLRYVSSHEFLGQTIKDYDVCDTTIARGLIAIPEIVAKTRAPLTFPLNAFETDPLGNGKTPPPQ